MTLIDIHTHNADCDRHSSIFNSKEYVENRNISIGIHPWDIDSSWEKQLTIIKELANKENIRAIGECGIDKLKSQASTELQKEIFKVHALLAEEVNKPIVIHCVKGFDELIAMRRELSPKQAWIIHGFRGKPQQAGQLIKEGFYISFGEKFNIDSLKALPLEKLFVESDESKIGIANIYNLIANAKGCSIEELSLHVITNARRCNLL